jgi:lipopolysaccharide export LptBFGC system permease protein LptF
MMSLLALSRRRWVIAIGVGGALLGYYTLVYFGREFAMTHQLSPPVAAWLANGVFTIVSVALMTISGLRQVERRSPAAS